MIGALVSWVVGDLIKVVVVISSIESAVVILGVRVIGFRGAAPVFMVFVFSVAGLFSSATFLGGLLGLSGVTRLFLLSRPHNGGDGNGVSISGPVVDGDRGFWS